MILEEAVQQWEGSTIIKERFDQIKIIVNDRRLFNTGKIDDVIFMPIYQVKNIRNRYFKMKLDRDEL